MLRVDGHRSEFESTTDESAERSGEDIHSGVFKVDGVKCYRTCKVDVEE